MPRKPDPDAALFEYLRPRLTAISCRIVRNRAEAEDVVQDCFLAWQRAGRDTLATPAAWLTTVVQHRSIDRLRKQARDAAAAQAAHELAQEAAPVLPEEELIRRAELADALTRLRARLSAAQRLALVLHEALDCAHADIAAVLGTSPANARQLLARARRRLREGGETVRREERLCRELVRRFQSAIQGMDVPEVVNLLTEEQPACVQEAPPIRARSGAANDACYTLPMRA